MLGLRCRTLRKTPEYKISRHAAARIRERLGINKSGVVREALRGEAGMPPEFLSGSLRTYVDRIATHPHMMKPGANGTTRVTPNAIFVYCNGVLVTVMRTPKRLRKSVNDHWERFRADEW